MKYDEVLRLIGEMGPYQTKILVLVSLTIIPEAFHSMIGIFYLAEIDSWCAVGEWAESAERCAELSLRSPEYVDCIHRYRDASIPIVDDIGGESVYAKCEMYDVEYPNELTEGFLAEEWANATSACRDGWMFDRSQYSSTIVSDFNLVCDRKYLMWSTQSVFYFGYLVGSAFSGSIADIIGRYYTLFLAVTVNFVASFAMVFSPNVWFFCICRFLIGAGNISLYLMSFVIATELLGPSKRSIGGLCAPFVFGVGYALLALAAYLIRDWRHLQLLSSLMLLPIYLLIPILPESARWLMAHQKFDKTEEIIRKIAKSNKTTHMLPENLTAGLKKEQQESAEGRKYTLLDVLRQPRLRLAALVFFFEWPVISMMYFGLNLNMTKFGRNPYVTVFLSSVADILACFVVIPLIASPLGRKYTVSGLIITGGIACFITIFASGIFVTATAMVGKFCVSASYYSIYIYTAEIFPTAVRSIGMGASSTAARLGSILAPVTLMMGDLWEPLPLVIYGTLSLIAGSLLIVQVPETRGKILTATLEEGEEFLANPEKGVPRNEEVGVKI